MGARSRRAVGSPVGGLPWLAVVLIIIALVILVIILLTGFRIVQEYERGVIFRSGE